MECEFHPGDTVVIREWNDMEAEFGLDRYNNIQCNHTFIDDMKYLCGQVFVIKRVDPVAGIVRFECNDPDYIISTDMIRLVEADNDGDDVDLDSFISILNF